MRRILIIGQNTFRETVRDKILYNLLIFVLVLIGASLYIGELSINPDVERKTITDLGLSVMLLFGFLISVFIGTGLVYKEIDKRTIYSLLSKPVRRHEFILGKFLGLAATLGVNCSVMVLGLVLSLIYTKRAVDPSLLKIFPTAFLIYLELLLTTVIALLFSSFSSPALSVFFSLFLYIIGNFTNDLKLFADVMNVEAYPSLVFGQFALRCLYYLLPNLSNFNFITRTAYGDAIPWPAFVAAVGYFCVYVSILLSLTVLIFERRHFK